MFKKNQELTNIIDREIEIINQEILEIKEDNLKLVEIYNDLSNNINNLIYIKKDTLKKIIKKFNIENYKDLYNELKTIRKILTMNKEYKCTLRLFKKNKDAYNYFLENFSNLIKKDEESDPDILKLKKNKEEYNSLKEIINKEKFAITKKEVVLIEKLFEDDNTKESQDIISELIEYENTLYQDIISKAKKKPIEKVNEKDFIYLFKKYNYNYLELEKEYQKLLITNGNIKNITEMFKILEKYEYPTINNNYILVSILLGSSEKCITEVTEFAKENKILPKDLLEISGALICQNDNKNTDFYSIMTTGSSIDFMRNIKTLKDNGINIDYLFKKCKSILTIPNKLLEKNLDAFKKYGFSFDYKKRGIIDPSPCALMSLNFAEIVDAFIEINPNGLKYLVDNLSNLKTVSNPLALMFYNIYACTNKAKTSEDGPFRKVLEENNENYQLKAIITRNRPDLHNTYYLGITEENKQEKTNTITPKIKGKNRFDKIIKNSKEKTISNSIFNNTYIQAINKYIDYDNALIYNFNDVRISRLKVLRIYNTLIKNGIKDSIDSFMYAITYNTIINKENYDKIYNCIKEEIEIR